MATTPPRCPQQRSQRSRQDPQSSWQVLAPQRAHEECLHALEFLVGHALPDSGCDAQLDRLIEAWPGVGPGFLREAGARLSGELSALPPGEADSHRDQAFRRDAAVRGPQVPGGRVGPVGEERLVLAGAEGIADAGAVAFGQCADQVVLGGREAVELRIEGVPDDVSEASQAVIEPPQVRTRGAAALRLAGWRAQQSPDRVRAFKSCLCRAMPALRSRSLGAAAGRPEPPPGPRRGSDPRYSATVSAGASQARQATW